MWIIRIFYKILSGAVKLIKMFYFKLLKVNLNTVLETIVFGVCGYILIKIIYDILIKDVMVSCLNFYTIGKENF